MKAFTIACVLTTALGAHAHAQTVPDTPDRPAFGLVGITRGQSARVNVSISNPDLRPGELPAGPCHVTLGFVNDRNQPFTLGIRGDTAIAADGLVNPGGSLSLEIRSSQVFTTGGGGRQLLRPVVVGASVPDSPDLPAGPCHGLVSTLELLDSAAGATSVLYAPTTLAAIDPAEQPAFGLVGVVRGQGAELHVFVGNPDLRPGTVLTDISDACQVNLAFADATGAPILDRGGRQFHATGILMPGESLTLSLASADVFSVAGRRRGIRAVVSGELVPAVRDQLPAGPCRGLVPTLEIVDGQGQTSILYAPALYAPGQ